MHTLRDYMENAEPVDKTTENWENALLKIIRKYVEKPYQDFTEREKWVAVQSACEDIIKEYKQKLRA